MNRQAELQVSLTVIISFFLHIIIVVIFIIPQINDMFNNKRQLKNFLDDAQGRRYMIENINPDNARVITKETYFSDKDSTAKGFITTKRGDRWLNNSLDFVLSKASRDTDGRNDAQKGDNKSSVAENRSKVLVTDKSEITITIDKGNIGTEAGGKIDFDKFLLPDKYNKQKENAIFYSTRGIFSFNTIKFKNYKYMKDMCGKVGSNWNPPLMANAVMYGYNPLTGNYTPGYTRIMAIPNQEVLVVFVLDKAGEVQRIKLVDSMGYKVLNKSCVEAVQMSKNFGKVPDELLEDGVLIIFFTFRYIID